MKRKKEIGLGMLLISIIQILLMLNTIPAESYLLDQIKIDFNELGINNGEEKGNLIPKLGGFLISLISIKQIGTVSALESEEIGFKCCLETNSGASCQEIASVFPNDDPSSCENPLEGRCEENIQCQTGTCIFDKGLSCSAKSPRGSCEKSGGTWDSRANFEIPECTKGACILGKKIDYVTEKQCILLSESEGLEMDFRGGVSELEIPFLEGEIKEGACVLPGNNCRFVTINECNAMLGSFIEGMLCSNPVLGVSCNATEETICVGDSVHFKDSCGNPGNVYDASKVNAEENPEYWNNVVESTCTLDLDNPSSVRNCGSCNLFASSKCVPDTKNIATYGNNICKDIRCIDRDGKTRLNGEKWCSYDGFIGEGKDTPGSEHWLESCDNGEVEVDLCGGYRGQICEQRIINEEGLTFSTALCVVNEALRCLDDSQECEENAHCMTKNVDVDDYFKFSACVPKYPRGFDLTDTSDAETICSVANNECTVVYTKNLIGKWECTANCDCETSKFSDEMNDLCVSLGDCGSYVNYQGEGSNNIQVTGGKGSAGTSWTKYKQYADVVEGQFINATEASNLISPIGSADIEGFKPEEASDILSGIGATGVSMGLKLAVAYFPVTFGKTIFLGEPLGGWLGPEGGFEGIQNMISGVNVGTLTSFGIGIVGGVIGSYIGKYITKSFGITGTAATVVVMAASIAGSSGALILAQTQLGINLGLNLALLGWTAGISIAIIIFIIAIGWGKTKEVKVNFTCLPWQPPRGGDDCSKCTEDSTKPCTKYRCESLGSACKLLNANTNNPICESTKQESIPPKISLGGFRTEGYEFQNEENNRVEIRKENGDCVQEFIPIEFTLRTDENAQCRWDLQHKSEYDLMNNFGTGGTTFALEHGFLIQGLSLSILEANDVTGNLIDGFTGNVDMFVRCQDYHGNFNINEYTVNFCMNTGPDETPVEHGYTIFNPMNNGVLKFEERGTNLTMWINEPAECKYDKVENKGYNDMSSSFVCNDNLGGRELRGWPCYTNLENLGNTNDIFIKCKDQPWKIGENASQRNVNTEDLKYTLRLSESELSIDSISITHDERKTILNQDSRTDISGGGTNFEVKVGVETSGGSNNGEALCSYESNGNFIPFLNTNKNTHDQEFRLLSGDYDVSIKCRDSSGNEAEGKRDFKLNIDTSPPRIIRAYHQSGNLNLITDEQAKCYVSYDNVKQCGFSFNNLSSITSTFKKEHSIKWDTEKTYYVKCEDLFGEINPTCAIKVNPSPI
jgi:hypothetical protein